MHEALMATDEMKHAVKELAMRNQPRHIQLARMRAEVGKLIEKVSRPMFCDLCDGAYVAELHKSVERRVKELNQFQAGLEREDAVTLQSRLEPVRRRMLHVIRTTAEAKGIGLVLDAKASYIHPKLDLTAEAVATYNKFHPVF